VIIVYAANLVKPPQKVFGGPYKKYSGSRLNSVNSVVGKKAAIFGKYPKT
jgi:hypothetical protein